LNSSLRFLSGFSAVFYAAILTVGSITVILPVFKLYFFNFFTTLNMLDGDSFMQPFITP